MVIKTKSYRYHTGIYAGVLALVLINLLNHGSLTGGDEKSKVCTWVGALPAGRVSDDDEKV